MGAALAAARDAGRGGEGPVGPAVSVGTGGRRTAWRNDAATARVTRGKEATAVRADHIQCPRAGAAGSGRERAVGTLLTDDTWHAGSGVVPPNGK